MKIKKPVKIIFIIIVVALLAATGYYVYQEYFKKQTVNETKIIHEMKEYGYTLSNHSTELFKDTFYKLEKVLESDEVNEEEYTKLVAQLFIIDFYTLDNKITNNDIGGVQFLHDDIKDNFILKAKDTLYKYVESNVYNDRKQELPEVKSIEVVKVEDTKSTLFDQVYEVEVNFDYKKDLGFDTKKTLYLTKEAKKISVIEIK